MPEEMKREERRRETTTTFSAGVDVERQLRPPAPQAAELEGLSLRRGGGGRRPLAGPASRVPTTLFLPLSSGALTLSLPPLLLLLLPLPPLLLSTRRKRRSSRRFLSDLARGRAGSDCSERPCCCR